MASSFERSLLVPAPLPLPVGVGEGEEDEEEGGGGGVDDIIVFGYVLI
jgi:hypothetical protein